MNPPFLLPNLNTIFHNSSLQPSVTDENQYYIVCFLYQLFSQQYTISKRLSPVPNVTIESYDFDANGFIVNGEIYNPYELASSIHNTIPIKTYPECCRSSQYSKLLYIMIPYAGLIGFLSGPAEYRPARIIPSNFWNVEYEWFESTNPMYHLEVIRTVKDKKPCIVTGGTGTGKTKVVPKLFFYYYCIYNSPNFFQTGIYAPDVVMALPRVFLAKNTYNDYKKALGYDKSLNSVCPLQLFAEGEIIKWPTEFLGPKFKIGTSESLFKFSTTCGLSMIDEFHEHDLKSDIFFSLLFKEKKHIVLITATPSKNDESLFPKFMPDTYRIHIASSKVFEVTVNSQEATTKNYAEIAQRITIQIANNLSIGQALLVFLPTVESVNKLVSNLQSRLSTDIVIVPFYSTVITTSRDKIESIQNDRKVVIVATQAAESSVTFPTLVNVIDAGMEVRIVMKQQGNFHTYKVIPEVRMINQYQYQQRRGRVGRRQRGKMIALYDPKKLSTESPDVLDGNLTTLVLLMRKYNILPDDLFVIMSGDKKKLFEEIYTRTSYLDISQIPADSLKNIYWLESIQYLSNPNIPDSDKSLYLELWETKTFQQALNIYNKIRYQSYIPKRRVYYLRTKGKYVYLWERYENYILEHSVPLSSFKEGFSQYDQVSLTYTIPA